MNEQIDNKISPNLLAHADMCTEIAVAYAAHVLAEKTPSIRADERLKVLREIQRVALDTFGKSRGRKSVNDHIGELVRQMDSDLTVAQVAKEMEAESR